MLLFPSLPTSPFKFSPKKCVSSFHLYKSFSFFFNQNFISKLLQKSVSEKDSWLHVISFKKQRLLWSKEIFASLHMKTRVSHLHIPTIYLPFDIMEDNLLVISSREYFGVPTVESQAKNVGMVLSFQLYGLDSGVDSLFHVP